MSGYILHPDAYTDLDSIWEYIAVDNIVAADQFLEQIHDSIRNLAQPPDTGHWRTDLAPKTFRFKTVGSYLIAYVSNETPLLVLAIVHGSRQTKTIAALLRERKTTH